MIRYLLDLVLRISHGDTDPAVFQHLYIVFRIAECDALFRTDPFMLYDMTDPRDFASAPEDQIDPKIIPSYCPAIRWSDLPDEIIFFAAGKRRSLIDWGAIVFGNIRYRCRDRFLCPYDCVIREIQYQPVFFYQNERDLLVPENRYHCLRCFFRKRKAKKQLLIMIKAKVPI